jgi:hypothetical protein
VSNEDGVCRTCKWCEDFFQMNGYCHAHPYTKKPGKDALDYGVSKYERMLCFPVVNTVMDWCKDYEQSKDEPVTIDVPRGVWICHECGREHGRLTTGVSTWHYATCDWCGEVRGCTEARDFGL